MAINKKLCYNERMKETYIFNKTTSLYFKTNCPEGYGDFVWGEVLGFPDQPTERFRKDECFFFEDRKQYLFHLQNRANFYQNLFNQEVV